MLEAERIVMHPLVVGELAMGNLADRRKTLEYLRGLPAIAPASDEEVHGLVEAHHLNGTGLGWADAHLLAAAKLSGAALLSMDEPLRLAAVRLGVDHRN